jgi:hypothetical protein
MTVTNSEHVAEWLKRYWDADEIVLRKDGIPAYAYYKSRTYLYDPNEANKINDGIRDGIHIVRQTDSEMGHEPKGSFGG